MDTINIFDQPEYDSAISREEIHTYHPRASTFKNNDECRFIINHADLLTLPSESHIYIEGDINLPAAITDDQFNLVNNAYAFLFEEIRYELNGVEVAKCRDLGITTSMKSYISYTANELNSLELSGWLKTPESKQPNYMNKKFHALIPLKCMLGIMEDYNKIVCTVKQELILMRSKTDVNCYKCTVDDPGISINISNIEWRVPHITLSDESRLSMLTRVAKDEPISIPFRKWQINEFPGMRNTNNEVWQVNTTTNLSRPRYIIIGFQNNRKDNAKAIASQFDNVNIRNIKVFLNEWSYPYTNMNLNFTAKNYAVAYKMYESFQKSYYDKHIAEPLLSYSQFKDNPLFVFDTSKQMDTIKESTVDLKIEFETTDTVFEKTVKAFCLIISDSLYTYTPLTGIVRKLI